MVRAAFHYIPTGTTVAPVDLLDADGIGRLIAAATDRNPLPAPTSVDADGIVGR